MTRTLTVVAIVLLAAWLAAAALADQKPAVVNPAIDMDGYLQISRATARHREDRRLSQEDFLRLSREPGTVILDARSREKYDELHIAGAIHLDFADIAVSSLARTIPDHSTRILIYCNNNFINAEGPFPSKLPSASLNLATHIALYNYGYENVYELGPQVDIGKSMLVFESAAKP